MLKMSENSNKFLSDFMPKTDETFIAPNENFNSFSHKFNNFGLKSSDNQNPKPENEIQILEEQSSKRKTCSSVTTNDKFIDFILKQYKSDGFISTLDENERQIYYCYYCHQYVSDFDLIQTHIDSAKHLNNILNGISFDRGLDKEFVIESISEKRPKNIHKLIYKELSRLPLHLKHYYFRNNIRLMDVMPPNAYFCKSCNESITDFKSINNHLLTEKHILSQQKPSLMQLIEKTEDPVLKIGLEFITEEKIADSSHLVYECELCKCFDCNNDKMFSHIKSREHRINLLKSYDFETKDLFDEEIENLIQQLHEKHGSGLMKISKNNKKVKTSPIASPDSHSSSNSAKRLTPEPKSHSKPNLSSVLTKVIEKEKINNFLRKDKLLVDFEKHNIIETYESDGREIFYCCYCDEYYNSFQSMERHIEDRTHKNFLTDDNNCSKSLNRKLSMKRVSDPSIEPNEFLNNKYLENIPILEKHFYYKRGIKHLFDDVFYCRFCQIRVEGWDAIECHFETESHNRIEENPTKFNDLLFQTNQPIIGLKYIKELINEKTKHFLYECILCDYIQDFCQMFVHLNCFSHQFKVLRKLSPNNKVFKCVKENEVSLKSSELLKEEISRIEEDIGCGFITKSVINSPKEEQKSSEVESENCEPKTSDNKCDEQMDCLSAVSRPQLTDENKVSIESIPNLSNEENKQSIPLTEEELLSSLQSLFTVELKSEDEASVLVAIVESLKDSLIKYYNVIPLAPKQVIQNIIQSENNTSDKSNDNYEVCEMDEC